MDEQWRMAVGFPYYEVSDHGRVRSFITPYGTDKRLNSPRILHLYRTQRGYLQVWLYHNRKNKRGRKAALVHKLVLEAFIGKRPDGFVCRHLDGNSENNRLSNLCWGTQLENMNDKYLHGNALTGERNPRAKLTKSDVLEIRASKETGVALAAKYRVTPANISFIRKGKGWKGVA